MRELIEAQVRPSPAESGDRDAIRRYVERTVMTGQHISSSCRMGPADDPASVVGPDCRVHGLEGLRIIDGSVMPDSIRANTHATILAMAELVAGRLLAGG